MAILNRIPDTSAFPNTNGTGMTMRQWYKGQILAGMTIGSSAAKGDMLHRARIVGEMADALIEEDLANG